MTDSMTTSHSSPTSCETHTDTVALTRLRNELAQLAEAPHAASAIVQHPDWLLFEIESRGQAASPYVVVVRNRGGRIIGYAPFLRESRRARIALGSIGITLYRGDMLRLLGDRVVSTPEDRHAAEGAIIAALKADPSIRVIYIQETILPNALATTLSSAAQRFRTVYWNLLDQINWTIQAQPSAQAWLAAMSSKQRNDLARRLRKMYKKLGEQAQLRTFETPADMDEYCRLLNALYPESWQAAMKPIDWQLASRRALFKHLAQQQQIIGHVLMLGERPIAYVHGYRLGGHYLLDETGYDSEFATLGVGSSLVFQAVQDLLDRHPGETIDFGYGDNQYKRVLATQATPCGSLYLVRGVVARICFGMIAPLRGLYRGARHAHEQVQAVRARRR